MSTQLPFNLALIQISIMNIITATAVPAEPGERPWSAAPTTAARKVPAPAMGKAVILPTAWMESR